jgi:hypothetical protein
MPASDPRPRRSRLQLYASMAALTVVATALVLLLLRLS